MKYENVSLTNNIVTSISKIPLTSTHVMPRALLFCLTTLHYKYLVLAPGTF